MFQILLSVLMTTAYLTDVKAYNIVLKLPNYNETENLTVVEDYVSEKINNTNLDNPQDYFYIDFPRIGYQIFKNKMAQAMEMYESFMNKNPVILKVDKSNLSDSGTINLTILNNNISEKVYTNFSDMQQNPETNTESPIKGNSTEVYESIVQNILESSSGTQSQTNYSISLLEDSKENKTASNETSVEENKNINFKTNTTANAEENQPSKVNETNTTTTDVSISPTEVAPVGFLGKISNTVTNIFHSLTSWF